MIDERYSDKKFIYSLYDKMDKCLKRQRYVHSIGVAGTAASLAMKYDANIGRAQVAGILHDCAKCYTDDELIGLCRKHEIEISEFEEENGFLLHAKYGAFLAKNRYGIDDTEVLNAIRWHTTGRADMTLLEKIVFIADYIEPSRNKAKNLQKIRKMVFDGSDIDRALVMIMHDTIDYLHESGSDIDETTMTAYRFYESRLSV